MKGDGLYETELNFDDYRLFYGFTILHLGVILYWKAF